MASMYDEMDLESEEAPVEETEESEGDAQFEMHARAAGMDTPEKLEAFKAAIERCVTLREENMYAKDADADEADVDSEDEDAEI